MFRSDLRSTPFLFLGVLTLLLLASPIPVGAQCSDAGVCSIGSTSTGGTGSIQFTYVFGTSGKEDDLTYHTMQIEGTFSPMENSMVSIMLPWHQARGTAGTASGVGDLVILWDQTLTRNGGERLSFQVGGKFGTGGVNRGGLPQAYQPGLGTNDLLLGIVYEDVSWHFAAGYQLSGGRCGNAIDRLKRGDDLFGRGGYTVPLGEASAGLELLAVKRLRESSVLRPASGGSGFVFVPGSAQFQLNMVARVTYPLTQNLDLRGLAAVPLRNRNVNVDGLTRSVTLSVGVRTRF